MTYRPSSGLRSIRTTVCLAKVRIQDHLREQERTIGVRPTQGPLGGSDVRTFSSGIFHHCRPQKPANAVLFSGCDTFFRLMHHGREAHFERITLLRYRQPVNRRERRLSSALNLERYGSYWEVMVTEALSATVCESMPNSRRGPPDSLWCESTVSRRSVTVSPRDTFTYKAPNSRGTPRRCG